LIPAQNEFYKILFGYTVSFIGLLGIYFSVKSVKLHGWIVSVALLIPIFCFPNLSDDIYRFFWDGILMQNGISPYAHLPSQLIDENFLLENLKQVFPLLNSPDYYSIYPPINQVFFYLFAFIKDIIGFAIGLKILYAVCHFLAWYGWDKFISKDEFYLLYFANPLVIIEGIGNLHAEIVMIAFLIATYISIEKYKPSLAGLTLALAVSVKLLPLMLLPYLFLKYKKNHQLKPFLISFMLTCFVCFVPLVWSLDIENLIKSVDLYFRKFEFNASLYYIERWLGFRLSGYNQINLIGPLNGLVTMIIILYFSYKNSNSDENNFLKMGYISFMVYLLLATTVHPWYIMTPLFFSLQIRYWHVVVWSFVSILSYANYYGAQYEVKYWMIALEYVVLFGWMIYELRLKKVLS
jgi:hypothetical protein